MFQKILYEENFHMNDERTALTTDKIIFNGKEAWRIISEIGRGGIGLVYKIQNIQTQEFAALKEFYPIFYCNKIYRDRNGFLQFDASIKNGLINLCKTQKKCELEMTNDARRSEENNNPFVYDVEDFVFTYDSISDEIMYIIKTENGSTLNNVINDFSNSSQLGELLLHLIYAIETLHAKGIIHGDIKLSNIYIETDFSVKLLDFGTSFYKGKVDKTHLNNYTFLSYSDIIVDPHRKSIIDSFFRRLNLLSISETYIDSFLKKYNRLTEDVDYYAIFSILYFLKFREYPNLSKTWHNSYSINEKLDNLKVRSLSKSLFINIYNYFYNVHNNNLNINQLIKDYINAEYCESSPLWKLNNYLTDLRKSCKKDTYFREWVRIEQNKTFNTIGYNDFFPLIIKEENATIVGYNASGKKSLFEDISIRLIDEICVHKIIPIIGWMPECNLPDINIIPADYILLYINEVALSPQQDKSNGEENDYAFNTYNDNSSASAHYINIIGINQEFSSYVDDHFPYDYDYKLLLLDKIYLQSILKARYVSSPFILFPPIANIFLQNETVNCIADAIDIYVKNLVRSSDRKYDCFIARIMEDIFQLDIAQFGSNLYFINNESKIVEDAICATGLITRNNDKILSYKNNLVEIYIKANHIFRVLEDAHNLCKLNEISIDYDNVTTPAIFELLNKYIFEEKINIQSLYESSKGLTKLLLGAILLFNKDITRTTLNFCTETITSEKTIQVICGISKILSTQNKFIQFDNCQFDDIFNYPTNRVYDFRSDEKLTCCGKNIQTIVTKTRIIKPVLAKKTTICGYYNNKQNRPDYSKPIFSPMITSIGTVESFNNKPNNIISQFESSYLYIKDGTLSLRHNGTTTTFPNLINYQTVHIISSFNINGIHYIVLLVIYIDAKSYIEIMNCDSKVTALKVKTITVDKNDIFIIPIDKYVYIIEKDTCVIYVNKYSYAPTFNLIDSYNIHRENINCIKAYEHCLILYNQINNIIEVIDISTSEFTKWKLSYPYPLKMQTFNGCDGRIFIEFYGYSLNVLVIDINDKTLHTWKLGYNTSIKNINFVDCKFIGEFKYDTICAIKEASLHYNRNILYYSNGMSMIEGIVYSDSIEKSISTSMKYQTFSFQNFDDVSEAIIFFNNNSFSQFLLRHYTLECTDSRILSMCLNNIDNDNLRYEWALDHCMTLTADQIIEKQHWIESIVFKNYHFEHVADMLYSLAHKLYDWTNNTNKLTKDIVNFLLELLKISMDKGCYNASRTYNEYFTYRLQDLPEFLVFYEI